MILLHSVPLSAALKVSCKPSPVHAVVLFSQITSSLPLYVCCHLASIECEPISRISGLALAYRLVSLLVNFYQRCSISSAGIARAEMSICLSVRPSVCHTLVLYQNEHDFFIDGQPEDSTV